MCVCMYICVYTCVCGVDAFFKILLYLKLFQN